MIPTPGAPSGRGVAVAAAGAAIVLWSLNATAAGAALAELSVLQVLALQFGGAFVSLLIARRVGRRGADSGSGSGSGAAMLQPQTLLIGIVGLTGTITLQYVAFATAPLVAANAIAYAWPLLTVVWVALHPGGRRLPLLPAVVGFSGVVLLFAARDAGGSATASAPLVGYLAALGSAVAMAGYTLAAARTRSPATDLLLAGTGAGALLTLPAALAQGEPWSPGWAVAVGLGIGVAMMAAGYGLWTLAMAHPVGVHLAPAAYTTPMLSTGLLLATGSSLSTLGLLGCGLILLCAAGVGLDAVTRRGTRTGPLDNDPAPPASSAASPTSSPPR